MDLLETGYQAHLKGENKTKGESFVGGSDGVVKFSP